MKSSATSRRLKAARSRRVSKRAAVGALPRTLRARSRRGDTALQRHVSFFDDDGDRGVGFSECARGLRALGMPLLAADAVALMIVAGLSLQTRGSLLAMNVDVDQVHKGVHEGDTGVLDEHGRFDASRFERAFGRHARVDRRGNKAFTAADLARMLGASRGTFRDYALAMAEWGLLLALAADTSVSDRGRTVPALSVARLQSFYQGTLFYKLAKERPTTLGATSGRAAAHRSARLPRVMHSSTGGPSPA